MNIGEVIHRVNLLLNNGVLRDDAPLTNRLIYNKLIGARALLLSQAANKKQDISQWNMQRLSAIPLYQVMEYGTYILRSERKLPKPITSLYGELIQSVLTLDDLHKIDMVTPNMARYQLGHKYSQHKPLCFIRDAYLYVTVSTDMPAVHMVAAFEDIIEAALYNGDEDDYMSIPFYISDNMVDACIQIALSDIIGKKDDSHDESKQ